MAQGDYDPTNGPLIDPGQSFFEPPYQSSAAPGSGGGTSFSGMAPPDPGQAGDQGGTYGRPNIGNNSDYQTVEQRSFQEANPNGGSFLNPYGNQSQAYHTENPDPLEPMNHPPNPLTGGPRTIEPPSVEQQVFQGTYPQGGEFPNQSPIAANARPAGAEAPKVNVPDFSGAGPQAMAVGQDWYVDAHGQFHSGNDGANIRANRPFADEGYSVGPSTLVDRGAPKSAVGSADYNIPSYGDMVQQGRTPNLYGYGEAGTTPTIGVPIPGYQPSQGPEAQNYRRNSQDQINQQVPVGQGGFPTAQFGAPMQVAVPGMAPGQPPPQGGQPNANGLGSLGGVPFSGGNGLGSPPGNIQTAGQPGQGLTANQRIQINPDGTVQVKDKSGFLAPSQWSEANTVINQSNRFDPNMIDKLIALSEQTVDPQLAARAKDQLSAHSMDFWTGKAPGGGAYGTDVFEQWRQAHTAQNNINGIPGQQIAPMQGGNVPFDQSSPITKSLVDNAMADGVTHRTDAYGNFFYTDPTTGKEVGPISQAQQPRLLQELMDKKNAAPPPADTTQQPQRNNRPSFSGNRGYEPPATPPPTTPTPAYGESQGGLPTYGGNAIIPTEQPYPHHVIIPY